MRKAKNIREACRAYLEGQKVMVTLCGTGEQISLQEFCKDTILMIDAGKSEQKRIDVGKLLALHNANWKNKDIAQEMHISECTVSKYIRRKVQ